MVKDHKYYIYKSNEELKIIDKIIESDEFKKTCDNLDRMYPNLDDQNKFIKFLQKNREDLR